VARIPRKLVAKPQPLVNPVKKLFEKLGTSLRVVVLRVRKLRVRSQRARAMRVSQRARAKGRWQRSG
jgi:hypothetical protein